MAFDAGAIEAKLTLDRSEFTKGLDQAKADADKFSGKDITAKVKADTTAASKGLTDTQALADKLGKTAPTVKVKADTAQANAEIDKTALKADRLGKKTETVKVKADTSDATKKLDQLQRLADNLRKGGGPAWLGPALLALPAVGNLAGIAGAAAIGMAGGFTAAAGAMAAFGAVAKPVLGSALKAQAAVSAAQSTYKMALAGTGNAQLLAAQRQQAITKAQSNYNLALAGGVKPAAALKTEHAALARAQANYNLQLHSGVSRAQAYKTEQVAITKAYANMSPAQIALSRQLGDMAQAWQNLKAAQTPVVAGALEPWLKVVTDLTKNLGPIIAKVSPVIAYLGTQFDGLVNSASFTAFRDFIGSTGSAAVSGIGSALTGLFKGFIVLLPQFDPLIREAVGWIARLGPAFATWAASQKTADHISAFISWFSRNGPVAGGMLKNIGAALKALAPGLTAGGVEELKILSGFFGFVAKLPPWLAKPLAATAGALLLLNKLGVFSVGVKFVGMAAGWVKKLLGGAAVDVGAAGMQRAGDTMVTAAGAMQRAADTMVGADAGAGKGGAAGAGLKGGAAGAATAGLGVAAGVTLAGTIAGAAIRALGDTLSPAGTFAGKLNAMLQGLGPGMSTSLLHSFTFGGLEAWLTAKIGMPVGNVMNKTADFITGSWHTTSAQVSGIVSRLGTFITGSWSATSAQVSGIIGRLGGFITGSWHTTYQGVSGTVGKMVSFITGSFDQMRHQIAAIWGGIAGYFSSWWGTETAAFKTDAGVIGSVLSSAWHGIASSAKTVFGGILGYFGTFWSGLKQGFQNAVNGVSQVWSTLKGAATGPVRFIVNTIYDHGIVPVVNAVGGLIGLHLSPVSFAAGGKVTQGTTPTADDVLARVSKDETVVSAEHSRLLAPVFGAVGVPGYAAGGIPNPIGAVGHAVSSVIGDAEKLLKDLTGDALAAAASHILVPLLNAMPGGGTVLGADLKKIPQKMVDALIAKLKGTAPAASSYGSNSGPVGGDAAANKALARKMFPWPASQWPAFDYVEMREAGYNRFARNPSSGAYGIPQALPESKLPPAGRASGGSHAGPQLSWMFDYVGGRYGNPAAAAAHERAYNWYGRGSDGAAAGWAVTGEQGPELVHMRGGETVLPAHVTRAILGRGGSYPGYAAGTVPASSLSGMIKGAPEEGWQKDVANLKGALKVIGNALRVHGLSRQDLAKLHADQAKDEHLLLVASAHLKALTDKRHQITAVTEPKLRREISSLSALSHLGKLSVSETRLLKTLRVALSGQESQLARVDTAIYGKKAAKKPPPSAAALAGVIAGAPKEGLKKEVASLEGELKVIATALGIKGLSKADTARLKAERSKDEHLLLVASARLKELEDKRRQVTAAEPKLKAEISALSHLGKLSVSETRLLKTLKASLAGDQAEVAKIDTAIYGKQAAKPVASSGSSADAGGATGGAAGSGATSGSSTPVVTDAQIASAAQIGPGSAGAATVPVSPGAGQSWQWGGGFSGVPAGAASGYRPSPQPWQGPPVSAQQPGWNGGNIEALLAQILHATRSVPGGVADGMGMALGGAAHDASFRRRYPQSGW